MDFFNLDSNYQIVRNLKKQIGGKKFYRYLILLSILFVFFYWMTCSFLDSIIYKENSFFTELIYPNKLELTHRLSVSILLIALIGVFVFFINKLVKNVIKITDRYDQMFNFHTDALVLYKVANGGENFIIEDFNDKAEKIEKVKKDEIIGKYVTEVFPGIEKFGLLDVLKKVYKTGEPIHHPIKHYKDNRLSGWRENHVYKLSKNYIVAEFEDKTEKKQLESKVKESEEKFRTIFESAPISIWIEDFSKLKKKIDEVMAQTKDIKKYLERNPEFIETARNTIKIKDVNPNTLKMYEARTKKELLGSLGKILPRKNSKILKKEILAIAEGKTYFEGETVNKTIKGREINVLLTMALPKESQNYDNIIVTNMDITGIKKLEQKLKERAKRDSLTNLYNHKTVIGLLGYELERNKRYEIKLSVAMLDIDDFKQVNDIYGHQAGDAILRRLSEILVKNVRNVDVVGRYGGEEFMIVFPHTDCNEAVMVCERIRKKVEEKENITVSIGVAQIEDENSKEIIKKVDNLLYKAKSKGKNCVCYK